MKKILIIGDTIIDHDIDAEVAGFSLETPTIKAKAISEGYILGGAAAVAKHLKFLGAKVTFLTACNDKFASLFQDEDINLINIDNEFSCIKTRVWLQKSNQRYKYLQLNHDKTLSSSKINDGKLILKNLLKQNEFEKIVISDYRLGVITDEIIKTSLESKIYTIGACQQSDKNSGLSRLKDCNMLVCNETEAENLNFKHNNLCITLGENGCMFKDKLYPSKSVEAFNLIGAGDSFLAAIAYSNDPTYSNNYARDYLISKNHESK